MDDMDDRSFPHYIGRRTPRVIDLKLRDGVLMYRYRGFVVDASGAFCGLTDWSQWCAVEERTDEE